VAKNSRPSFKGKAVGFFFAGDKGELLITVSESRILRILG
jgi:hypothetical protein